MQKKAAVCVVGILLLLVFGISVLFEKKEAEKEEEKGPENVPVPVVEILRNAYVTEVTDKSFTVFDGSSRTYELKPELLKEEELPDQTAVGRLVDLAAIDGIVRELRYQDTEKLSGKVLSASKEGVELEEGISLSFDEDTRFYILYGELRVGTWQEIRIGYQFADFVLKDDKVIAVLLTRDEKMEYIRVQIKTGDYKGNYHELVSVTCDTDFFVCYEREDEVYKEPHSAGETVTVTPESAYFTENGNRVYIEPAALTGKISLTSVSRSQGSPAYRGILELSRKQEGIVIINEVLLEEYLYAVVPSEMPASYPLEALKAQAICARTYAYSHMLNPGLPQFGAHVDDSTSYQVYNNITEQSAATTAVKETAGMLLYREDGLADTYYYSTSCGFGTDVRVWNANAAPGDSGLWAQSVSEAACRGEELPYTGETLMDEETFAAFIDTVGESDFEKEEPWYRWSYQVADMDEERILRMLKERYAAYPDRILTKEGSEYVSKPIEDPGKILNISVVKRGEGGVAEELLIEGEKASYLVIAELNIRYVLCDGKTKVVRKDGSKVDMNSLLPSAFFILTPVFVDGNMIGYELAGGGFGHGVGMSQNGARNMALAGYKAGEILEFFYPDGSVQKVE